MSAEAVLIQKSTKMIIKHGQYPREDMEPIEGLDPDYEWLIKHTPFPEPLYDPRIYIMQVNIPNIEFFETFPNHPEYPLLKSYEITYTPIKRSNEEIIASIENAKKEANDLVFSEAMHKDETVFMMNALLKMHKGFQLTAAEEEYANKISDINMKLSKNTANKNLLVDLVLIGQEPNIDSGWERL